MNNYQIEDLFFLNKTILTQMLAQADDCKTSLFVSKLLQPLTTIPVFCGDIVKPDGKCCVGQKKNQLLS